MAESCDAKNDPEVLFVGLARDCSSTLPLFFSFVERLEASGLNCAALLGENGSKDSSPELIENVQLSRVRRLDTSEMAAAPTRLARMAAGREILRLESLERFPSVLFICVMDMDDVLLKLPSVEELQSAIHLLRSDPTLFAVGATSTPVYYDLLALKAEGHSYPHLSEAFQAEARKPLTYFHFVSHAMYKNQYAMTRPEAIICESSFNGLCIYHARDYWAGSYRASDEDRVCEHLSLNLSIGKITGKKMVITPTLVVQAPGEHSPAGFWVFWLRRFKKIVHRLTDA